MDTVIPAIDPSRGVVSFKSTAGGTRHPDSFYGTCLVNSLEATIDNLLTYIGWPEVLAGFRTGFLDYRENSWQVSEGVYGVVISLESTTTVEELERDLEAGIATNCSFWRHAIVEDQELLYRKEDIVVALLADEDNEAFFATFRPVHSIRAGSFTNNGCGWKSRQTRNSARCSTAPRRFSTRSDFQMENDTTSDRLVKKRSETLDDWRFEDIKLPKLCEMANALLEKYGPDAVWSSGGDEPRIDIEYESLETDAELSQRLARERLAGLTPALRESGMAKLTDDEKKALGLAHRFF